MRKLAIVSAGLGLAALACGGTAVAATTSTTPTPQARVGDFSPQAVRYTQALNLLEAKGYTGFTNFRRAGSDFMASVTQNGRARTLMIDPDHGIITPKS